MINDNDNIENVENKEAPAAKQKESILDDGIVRNASYIMLAICIFAIIWLSFQVILLSQYMFSRDSTLDNFEQAREIMEEIANLYETQYIGEFANDVDNMDVAIQGFTVAYGDKYGYYLPPVSAADLADEQAEKLVGIGVEVYKETGKGCYVIRLMKDSPAKDSGINVGDYIVGTDEVSALDMDINEFIEYIRGESGTSVNVLVSDGDNLDDVRTVTVTRRDVVNESVYSTIVGDTAIVKIRQFTEKTDDEFKAELTSLKEQGFEKYIFDLRENTGGLADSVIDMLDFILPSCTIAEFRAKNPKDNVTYTSDKNSFEGNFAVIVNGNTASASELFSQVLQDYELATVIGTKTYGKGTVLSTYQLSNGGTVTLSTAKYYTPSGHEIEGVGVTPDEIVELTDENLKNFYKLKPTEDPQICKALDVLESVY